MTQPLSGVGEEEDSRRGPGAAPTLCQGCAALQAELRRMQSITDRLIAHMKEERELLLEIHTRALRRLKRTPTPTDALPGRRKRRYMTTEKLHEMRERAELADSR